MICGVLTADVRRQLFQYTNKKDEMIDNNKASFDPSIEPLLKENPRRFVILPIEFPDIWQMYKKAEGKKLNTANFTSSFYGGIALVKDFNLNGRYDGTQLSNYLLNRNWS